MSRVLSISRKKNGRREDSSTSLSSSGTVTSLILSNSSTRRSNLVKDLSKLSTNPISIAVQKSLKQLKRLEIEYSKFNSKTNGITKTNILRTSLLPFLRDPLSDFSLMISDQSVYNSLISISTNIFIKWWRALLSSLSFKNPSSKTPTISSTDRNAFLEGISRIISRVDWNGADPETYVKFQNLLVITLDYSIEKIQTLKIIPLSVSAFIGKVFAYSFFHLPQVSNALLFLLNVKQHVHDSVIQVFADESISTESVTTIFQKFPVAVRHLQKFKGFPKLSKNQKFYINAVPAPKHPVRGISDPNGSWVRRWCSSDSDIFNSFFRHYINITNYFLTFLSMPQDGEINHETALFNSPGFTFIMAHLLQIFQVSTSRICQNNPCFGGLNVFFKDQIMKNSNKEMPPSNINDIYYNSIVKLLKTCRDVKFVNSCISRPLIGFVDKLFIFLASRTSVYDHNKNGLLINIVYEFSNHVDNEINWEFWLSSCYLMISKTDHIQILLKNFAFLFNIWDLIPLSLPNGTLVDPKNESLRWITDVNESYKWNFANWLVSFPVWQNFFCHWEPITRTYYLRLLIWRLIGMNHLLNNNIKIEKSIDLNLQLSYDYVARKFANHKNNVSFKPDNPLVNRKFAILPFVPKEDFNLMDADLGSTASLNKSNELRKTHPYEIFDEAIYSCSSLPNSTINSESSAQPLNLNDQSDKLSRGNTLVSSLGRILKILSNEERRSGTDITNVFAKERKSGSATSLSTANSGSSSPSIMSSFSTAASLTDFSTESSIKSDSSSSTSSLNLPLLVQPPELLTRPPEIVRPIFRFDLVVDLNSVNDRLYITNPGILPPQEEDGRRLMYSKLPKYPRIPKFTSLYDTLWTEDDFITRHNGYQGELVSNDEDEEEDDDDSEGELIILPKVTNNLLFPNDRKNWVNIGKSLNEWNEIVREFEYFINSKVEDFKTKSNDNYEVYFKRAVPFLSVDSVSELKLLNAG